ncbi:uncharacterized protein I206_104820 [Kwoniella pini CBS 10737]|uniref:Uncharacterized protein n=1 Tax=Kwoniella pini CBS 10737 TaxID=1296096 RepID=A0A1B9I824_9TREE|nr:uncharacterized protein I206_02359 [Kwoniella pini CBS 10737]OCF51644.1 hypothetical protein I206_02359 [Kwoniella pini CBS 10737]
MTTILSSSMICPTKTAELHYSHCIEVTIVEAPSSPSTSTSSSDYTPSTCIKATRHLAIPQLSDEELWEAWFAYPSKLGMTLHRWAEGNKSALDMFIYNLPSTPPSSLYPLFLTKCRSTLSSLKILVLGSILLIRGVNHGPQMGRTLFGRILGDRYNDLMAFASKFPTGERVRLMENENVIKRSVNEAKGLQTRGNEFFAQGKYEAALEHYGMAIIKLIPWDSASLSPEISNRTGFNDVDQSLMLSIALTSIRIAQTIPGNCKSHLTIPGSRLYRLSKASCDYILHSPLSSNNNDFEGEINLGKEEELALKLNKLAKDIAEISSEESLTPNRSVREVREIFDNSRI